MVDMHEEVLDLRIYPFQSYATHVLVYGLFFVSNLSLMTPPNVLNKDTQDQTPPPNLNVVKRNFFRHTHRMLN